MTGVDSNVTARVIAHLLGYPRAGASVIEVSYARGIVTLSGTVESDAVRQALEEIARQQAGVRDVVNHPRVVSRRRECRASETGQTELRRLLANAH